MVVAHLAAAIFCLVVAIPVLVASQSIRLLGFDVMGGRAFPVALALMLIGLAVAKLVIAVRAMEGTERASVARFFGSRNPLAGLEREQLVVLGATATYMLLLLMRVGDFVWLSAAYMVVSGALGRFSRRSVIESFAITALVVALLLSAESFLTLRMIGR